MSENRNKTCIYCKEPMSYGLQRQVMSRTIDGIRKQIIFMQYGWKCSMKDDDCDIVFDECDAEKNRELRKL
jgi:hypothetical protein